MLSLGGGAYALLQSLVVPALPVLQHDLHTSTSGVAWVFTSYLLAASVVTPIAGRLGDMFGKKRVLVDRARRARGREPARRRSPRRCR